MKRSSDERKSRVSWSAADDDALLKAVLDDKRDREAEGGDAEDEEDWDEIAKNIPSKTPVQCLKRYMVINRKNDGNSSAQSKTTPSTSTEISTNENPEVDKKIESQEQGKVEELDPDDEEEDEEEKDSKRPRKEGETNSLWPQDDLDLLKKLVENYKDCKLIHCLLVAH